LLTSSSHAQDNIPTTFDSLRNDQPNFDRYGNRQYSRRRKVKRPDGTLAEESFKNARTAEKERQFHQSRKTAPEARASASDQRTRDQIVSTTEKPKQKACHKTNSAKLQSEHNPFSSQDTMTSYIPPHLRPEFLERTKNSPPVKCEKSAVVNNPVVLNEPDDVTNKDNNPPGSGLDRSKFAP